MPVALAAGLLGAMLASLAVVPLTLASEPVEVKCTELETKIAHAEPGEDLRLPAEVCEANITISTSVAFTLEGSPSGTTLKPHAEHASVPIITANEGGVAFTLKHLKLTGASGNSAIHISDPAEHVTITEDVFVGNSGSSYGGAIQIEDFNSIATLPTVISHNRFGAPGAGNSATLAGGALYVDSRSPLEVTDNTFIGNSVSARSLSFGGALAILRYSAEPTTSPVTVKGNVFGGTAPGAGNSASYSGGGAFIEPGAKQQLSVEGNSFIDNAIVGYETAEQARTGGGLTLAHGFGTTTAPVQQSGNVFAGNAIEATEAPGHLEPAGGAGEWVYGVTVHSSADRFEGNRIAVDEAAEKHPPEGGGLGVLGHGGTESQPGVFVGVEDLFIGNAVAPGGWGGAIYSGYPATYCEAECPGSSVTLEDSTVLGNSVEAGSGSSGGALWGSPHDNLTIENSIVYGNTPSPQVVGFGGTTSFAYSDLCNEAGGTAIVGSGLICANPLLSATGEETPASPTVDAGSNALVPEGLVSDLAGRARIVAGRCGDAAIVDMGAFELPEATECTTTSTSSTTTHTTTSSSRTTTSSSSTTTSATSTTSRPPTPAPPKLGPVQPGASAVAVTLSCPRSAVGGSEGEGVLFTTEHLRGKRVASLSRRKRGARRRSRTRNLIVGRKSYKLRPGESLRLKITLNAAGRRLLRRFHRLPVLLVVSARTAGGKATVLKRHYLLRQRARKRGSSKHAKR